MKKLLLVVVFLGLVGVGAGAYYMRHTAPDLQVNTAAVSEGPIVDTVAATGALQAVTTVQVGSQVSGNIKALRADFNSIVHKGQVIAELDPSMIDAQIQQARANLLKSQADVERLKVSVEDSQRKLKRSEQLAAKRLISESDLEAAQVEVRANQAELKSSDAQVTQARASLEQNQVNLQHTIILSPIDGIVISRNVDVGQTVAASFQSPTLFVLAADLTKMQVNANIDEADIGRIRPGQRVRFHVDAYPAEEFLGTVSQIRLQPVVVQNVTTYATVIDVPNPELKLKPGMTANVNVEVASRAHVVRVPNTALRFRPTVDMFAALNQPPPPELMPRGRPGGRPGLAGGAPAGAGRMPAVDRTAAPGAVADAPARSDAAPQAGADGGDRRARMMARLNQLPPAEREAALARMQARGPNTGGAPPAGAQEAAAAGPAPRTIDIRDRRVATIDALFAPLPPTVSTGRVWVFSQGRLTSLAVRLGITDGTTTEVLSDNLPAGADVVTSVSLDARRSAAGAGGRSPLMGPTRGRGR